MNLVFEIKKTKQKGQTPIDVILKRGKETYKAKSQNADSVLEALDKLLKKHKIEITSIKKIKTVDNFSETSYTSCRIIKSIEKALKFKL